MVIARFIIGLLTFVIGVVVTKIVLGIIGFALHLLWIAIVLGVFALIGWVVYKIIFPSHPANA
jgi:hypothetical protein